MGYLLCDFLSLPSSFSFVNINRDFMNFHLEECNTRSRAFLGVYSDKFIFLNRMSENLSIEISYGILREALSHYSIS